MRFYTRYRHTRYIFLRERGIALKKNTLVDIGFVKYCSHEYFCLKYYSHEKEKYYFSRDETKNVHLVCGRSSFVTIICYQLQLHIYPRFIQVEKRLNAFGFYLYKFNFPKNGYLESNRFEGNFGGSSCLEGNGHRSIFL